MAPPYSKSIIKAIVFFILILLTLVAVGCERQAPIGSAPLPNTSSTPLVPTHPPVTSTVPPTPSFFLLPTRIPGSPILTPTLDTISGTSAPVQGPETYIVQYGDTLGKIANQYGMDATMLAAVNSLTNPDTLYVGQELTIPHPTPQGGGLAFKIIPDSELIYGPMSITLDVDQFIRLKGGYLSQYTEMVDGQLLTGSQLLLRVAQFYSVNPRLLLAVLEYRSRWVTQSDPSPDSEGEPIGRLDGWHDGLYKQLTWTANELNRGYYLWKAGSRRNWVLADQSAVSVAAGINPGTAGVQNLFAQLDDFPTWVRDVSSDGLFKTYVALFGYPFDLAIEPIVPANLTQPVMLLPFEKGVLWAFTGGPHGGWDTGSAWAALDFAPAGTEGCVQSNAWVTAVADGLIVRTGDGAVVEDLDGDGYEQTGWTVLYMHMEENGRVSRGEYVKTGDRIGHPSCEGGFADATHLHIARKFNGEWISADGLIPFNFQGWVSSGTGVEYDGYLKLGGRTIEAFDGNNPINQIQK